ncbi:hypothetical protein N7456_001959 [Penicillium angulare]|uniref:Uncharacterized protein n=1 Tax=Penicillium angulare TaxID=116970 RepID=A0A9W9G7B2_9EURO|nr:hypothetical protein N7456_001959 [Penicillium angulare]
MRLPSHVSWFHVFSIILNIHLATSLTTTRYISSIPKNITIANTKSEIAQMQLDIPSSVFAENGGYYMKAEGGEVLAIASDRLCSILDDSHMSLYFHLKLDSEYEEAEELLGILRKNGIDADKLVREANDDIRHGGCVVDPEDAKDYEYDGDYYEEEDDDVEDGYLMEEEATEKHEL